MELNDYQKKALETQLDNSRGLMYNTLALMGESGEVAEKVKKLFRDKDGKLNDKDKLEIAKEIGDVLWYLSSLSRSIDYSLEDVARLNLDKTASRAKREKLKGGGDNR